MPTIEIASLNSNGLEINQDDFDIAIIKENRLESHRGLFYDFLSKQNGTIIHIGNPDYKNDKDNGFFAGNLINWEFEAPEFGEKQKGLNVDEENHWANQDFLFQFKPEYKNEIRELMQIAIETSPNQKIYFLTDYQFGPEKSEIIILNDLKEFWDQHEQSGLNWNTLYEIETKDKKHESTTKAHTP
jgi:hypothetical protein